MRRYHFDLMNDDTIVESAGALLDDGAQALKVLGRVEPVASRPPARRMARSPQDAAGRRDQAQGRMPKDKR